MPPPLRARLRGGVTGSGLTGRMPLLGVSGGAEPGDLDVDLDAEPDDDDVAAMRRGSHELPRRREADGLGCGGGICSTGKLPPSM